MSPRIICIILNENTFFSDETAGQKVNGKMSLNYLAKMFALWLVSSVSNFKMNINIFSW